MILSRSREQSGLGCLDHLTVELDYSHKCVFEWSADPGLAGAAVQGAERSTACSVYCDAVHGAAPLRYHNVYWKYEADHVMVYHGRSGCTL